MKYLLDTCLVSELTKPKPNLGVVEWINSVPEQFCALSVLTLGELEKGISKLAPSKKKTRLEVWLHSDLSGRFQGRIIPIELEISLKWGEISGQSEALGKPISVIDGLIASTALVNHLVVVTRNTSDFAVTEAKLLNPWED